jgi:DNA-binding SARP family transcriptional activator
MLRIMRLRLLGAFLLETEDGNAVSLSTKKTRALLAYLACKAGEPVTRTKLCGLFWEDSAPAQARDALRQALSVLRKALAPSLTDPLRRHSDTVIFDPGGLHVDVLEFQRLSESDDPADLRTASQLYRGPFLDGFDIQAPEFEAWMNSVHQQLNERAIRLLRKLLHHHISAGETDSALTVGSRLLSLDPLREGVYRSLMELHLRQGRYVDALRQYEQCAAVLRRDLGVEPDAQTRKLYLQILERRRRRQDEKQDEKPDQTGKALPVEPEMRRPPVPLPFPFEPGRLERRQMTVVACAMPGLNTLADSMELEELRPAVNACRERFAAAAARFGGVPAIFPGEIMLFYFGYPQAQEHGAEQAVRAGLALLEEAAKLDPAVFECRQISASAASSPVVAGDFAASREEPVHGLVGEAPGLALVLLSSARPGELVISEQTRNIVGDLFLCEPVSASEEADGAPPAENMSRQTGGSRRGWRVLGENMAKSRFEAFRGSRKTAFVGRAAEIELLLSGWRLARKGEGQFALISGEPGVGKSRLVQAFQELIRGESFTKLMYQCSPFHNASPLYPVIRHMEHTAGFSPDDSPKEKLDKLGALLDAIGMGKPETVRLCAALLSIPADGFFPPIHLPPLQLRRKILDVLLNQIERLASRRTLFMLIEDAHWMDASSLEALDLLSERARRLPAFVVITSRGSFEPAWSGLDHVVQLSLGGLDRRDARALIAGIAGAARLPVNIVDQIVDKTDGVPLFVEELVKSVLESGKRLQEGVVNGAADLAPLTVPATLRESLLARLDRLGPAKEIAQVGAVIGREFDYDLLRSVAAQPASEIDVSLERLVESGLVNKSASPSRRTYAFKHALVCDAAYETLTGNEKRRLHASIARAIPDHFPSEAHARPEIKARHYTAARLPREALGFWLKAGELAKTRSANREAVAHLNRGLRLIESASLEEPERRRWKRHFLMAIGPAVMVLRGYATPESEDIFERARQLIDAATPAGERISILRGLWSVQFARSNMAKSLELGEETLKLAASSGEALFRAHCMMGQTLTSMGEFRKALPHLQVVIEAFKNGKVVDSDPHFTTADYPWALVYAARALWGLGLTEQSAATAEEAVARARAGHDSAATAVAYLGRMFLAVHGAELREAMASAEEAIAHSTQQEMALFGQWIRFGQGALLAREGKFAAGIEIMRSAIEACDAMRGGQFRPFQLGCVAEAHLRLGDPQSALASVDEALAQCERSGEKQSAVSLRRLRGEILFELAQPRQALREMEAALKTARSQGARLEELRVSLALARTPQTPAEQARAMKMLRAIYDTFQEGFGRAYLQEAKKTLDAYERRER